MKALDYYIIAYDIADPKRLNRLYSTLKGFGKPLQFSIFECYLTPIKLVLLKEKIDGIINPDQDRVIIVRCCPNCRDRIETLGCQHTCEPPNQPTIV
jgi:CRISPR-associated protein Cas2